MRAEFELSSELVEIHELGRLDVLHELIQRRLVLHDDVVTTEFRSE